MDNHDQESNGMNEDHQEQGAKDEISSWLQGLEESDSEEENKDIHPEGHWVKETNDMTDGSSYRREDEDQTRMNHVEAQNINRKGYSTEQDDFIEISDLVPNSGDEDSQDREDEALSDNEELPDWLHEMIAEESPASSDETMPSEISAIEEPVKEQTKVDEALEAEEKVDEPTEPIDITQETPVEQEAEISNDPLQAVDNFKEPPLESEAAPLPVTNTIEEQEEQISEIPKTLRFAKFLLEQGDYNQAIEIINAYIDKLEFTEDIKNWLTDAVNNGANHNSAVWEALGDIGLNEGDSEQAIQAYTKAIDILLGRNEGSLETD